MGAVETSSNGPTPFSANNVTLGNIAGMVTLTGSAQDVTLGNIAGMVTLTDTSGTGFQDVTTGNISGKLTITNNAAMPSTATTANDVETGNIAGTVDLFGVFNECDDREDHRHVPPGRHGQPAPPDHHYGWVPELADCSDMPSGEARGGSSGLRRFSACRSGPCSSTGLQAEAR